MEPTISRAIWGTTRPTKPIMPATETVAAARKAETADRNTRLALTLSPRLLAISSPSWRVLALRMQKKIRIRPMMAYTARIFT